MPFALNEHTRFISPTKTPEYLAGGKAVVSSRVPDVMHTYRDVVSITHDVKGWLHTIEQLLAAPSAQRHERLERAQRLLAQSAWESIAEQMWALIAGQLGQAHGETRA